MLTVALQAGVIYLFDFSPPFGLHGKISRRFHEPSDFNSSRLQRQLTSTASSRAELTRSAYRA